MIILIVGGSKSGKSKYGELWSKVLSKNKENLYYLATMNPYDLEDLKRIEDHVESRKGYGFKTIEQYKDLANVVDKFSKIDTVLLDSLTSLVTNEMFSSEIFEIDRVNEKINEKILEEIEALTDKVNNLVIVSDYVFSDAILYDKHTKNFKKQLGIIHCNIAKKADVVVEAVYGNIIIHKGRELLINEGLI